MGLPNRSSLLAEAAAPELEAERPGHGSRGLVPRHVGIIMDGNGRWALAHGLPRSEGHRRGVEALRRAVRFAMPRDIGFLTLFGFSSENWARPDAEVEGLFNLLRLFIRHDLAELNSNGVRVSIIGDRAGLPGDIHALVDEAEALTVANHGLRLIIAFNYGSRDEIARAARRLARRVAGGDLDPEAIDQAAFETALDTFGTPDPDLIIRTSGEQRISNFLLWQASYAEFVFLPVLWPDFDEEHFEQALTQFAARDRRYGAIIGA